MLTIFDPGLDDVILRRCEQPLTTFLSGSDRLIVTYRFGERTSASLLSEGFEAKYSTVKLSSSLHDDIRQNGNEGIRLYCV